MFDWDRDVEELSVTRALPRLDEAFAEPEKSRRELRREARADRRAQAPARRSLMNWLAPGMFVLGLMGVGFGAVQSGAVPGMPSAADLSARLGIAHIAEAVFGIAPEMPAELLAYDRAQFDNFRRGIANFSDAELLEYARATEADLARVRGVQSDYVLDALLLTSHEIERRGLSSPTLSARLRASQAATTIALIRSL